MKKIGSVKLGSGRLESDRLESGRLNDYSIDVALGRMVVVEMDGRSWTLYTARFIHDQAMMKLFLSSLVFV